MFERVIRGGRVAFGDKWADVDIGIAGGLIAAIGQDLHGGDVLDARGLWVLPGGVDAHCHIDQPAWKGVGTADDFHRATLSAAHGGTTTVIPFAMPAGAMTAVEGLERSLACALGRAFVDFGLHGVATPTTLANTPDLMADLARWGAPSVKVYMTYEGFAASDDELLSIFDGARAHGITVLVHAENDAIIRRTRERLLARGDRAIRYHAVAHNGIAEREAVHRAISLCEVAGARLVIVHVSTAESAEEIQRGRERGVQVFGETCPQYLALTAADLARPVGEAIRCVFSPPPRTARDQEAMWDGLAAAHLAIVSSDHAPYSLEDKYGGTSDPAFDTIANGIPGLETRLPILMTDGLMAGRLSLPRYLDLAGRTAAALYGLDHCKGRIETGLDADIVLWDPHAGRVLHGKDLHSAVGYTPFEGKGMAVWPRTVLLRGVPVIVDGSCRAEAGLGRYIRRHISEPEAYTSPAEDATPWTVA